MTMRYAVHSNSSCCMYFSGTRVTIANMVMVPLISMTTAMVIDVIPPPEVRSRCSIDLEGLTVEGVYGNTARSEFS